MRFLVFDFAVESWRRIHPPTSMSAHKSKADEQYPARPRAVAAARPSEPQRHTPPHQRKRPSRA
eukprot:1108726-Rhodomonas_salina.1